MNVEIKARCADPARIREVLTAQGARHIGRDHQIDTYYAAPNGRLKLRRGSIENALIAYDRRNQSGPKRSNVLLYKTADSQGLKDILDKTLQTQVVVDKHRDIYFMGNIKFHVDTVEGLGSFVEIEAIDDTGTKSEPELRAQCRQYMTLLGIREEDLITHSYSDLVRNRIKN